MELEEAGKYIFGINENGNKFRPSDWVERIASTLGNYDASRRLRYNPYVIPTKLDGQYCLFVADILAAINPPAYQFVMDFVASNRLRVKGSFTPEPDMELQFVA